MPNKLITLAEVREIAERDGWLVSIDSDGWYLFRKVIRFDPKMFMIHDTDTNFIQKFVQSRERMRLRYRLEDQDKMFGAFEDLVAHIFDYIIQKSDVFLW